MLRSLAHYWRLNLAVVLGAAVATAVLTGALLVGDSVRGSLADLTLARLGDVDLSLVSERFFRHQLAADLSAQPAFATGFDGAAAAIILPAGAVHADSGARASKVNLLGVDQGLLDLLRWPDAALAGSLDLQPAEGQPFAPLIVNESLQKELGAAIGDPILLSFASATDVPQDTVLGESDPGKATSRIRLVLGGVIPDRGAGRFGLSPHQMAPLNAFVSLARVQRALERPVEVNGLFLSRRDTAAGPARPLADGLLRDAVRPEDLGLVLRPLGAEVSLESVEFLLRPLTVEKAEAVAARLQIPSRRLQTYLANSIGAGERSLPYSTVTAVDPAPEAGFTGLQLVDGSPAPALAEDEILLNDWAAADLGVSGGESIELAYYFYGPREELLTRETTFKLRGVVAMQGLAADSTLTPDYPGIADADDISAWDPPFPVDLNAIRKKDEDYWDEHRGTPKAFVSEAAGRTLWASRYGSTTALRLAVGGGPTRDGPGTAHEARAGDAGAVVDDRIATFRSSLLAELELEPFGLSFREVKEEGLQAAAGATDFGQLFLAFSFFIILSAALLVGLLFRLGVEQRAAEIGLLLSVGYPVKRVRRVLLGEGGLIAVIGAVLGVAGGVAYAWGMMAGLRTIWVGAVGSSSLFLHVQPVSLVAGFAISVLVILVTIWLAVRRLGRIPTPALLAGVTRPALTEATDSPAGKGEAPRRRPLAQLRPWLAFGGLAAGLGMMATAVVSGETSSPGLTFGAGAALLVAGLAFFSLWCRRTAARRDAPATSAVLIEMAARNSSWNPGRSILSVSLVAFASFVIVLVAANRQEHSIDVQDPASVAGGFSLLAETSVPLHKDLNRDGDRFDLGLGQEDVLAETTVFQFRLLPGNDASCLNLYVPDKPRVLGVPEELIERGSFPFARTSEETDNAWDLLHLDLGPGVVPAVADANSAQWILKKGLGDDVVLEDELGQEVRLRLVGLLQKGLFQSELLISEDKFLEHFPSRSGYSFFLVDVAPDSAVQAAEVLEAGLSRFDFDSTSTARRLAEYHAVESTYMATFQLLGGLGLLLGTVGLGVVLLRNVIERRRELATLRAFGYRRRRLAAMVAVENGFLLLLGLAIGTFSALLAVAPRLAGEGLHLPWLSLGATLAVVLVVGMISCVAAVQGALRVPLLPVLKAER